MPNRIPLTNNNLNRTLEVKRISSNFIHCVNGLLEQGEQHDLS